MCVCVCVCVRVCVHIHLTKYTNSGHTHPSVNGQWLFFLSIVMKGCVCMCAHVCVYMFVFMWLYYVTDRSRTQWWYRRPAHTSILHINIKKTGKEVSLWCFFPLLMIHNLYWQMQEQCDMVFYRLCQRSLFSHCPCLHKSLHFRSAIFKSACQSASMWERYDLYI